MIQAGKQKCWIRGLDFVHLSPTLFVKKETLQHHNAKKNLLVRLYGGAATDELVFSIRFPIMVLVLLPTDIFFCFLLYLIG